MFNAIVEKGNIKIKVIRSFLKDINIGDELIKINDQPALKFITDNMSKYVKQTYAKITAIKKYALFMSIKNPFNLIKSLIIKTNNSENYSINNVNIIR